MRFLFTVLGIAILLGVSLGIQDSYSEQLIEAHPTSLTYSVYQNPTISGTITDSNGDPISEIYVYSFFASEEVGKLTDEKGKFFLRSGDKYPPGEYSVEVYARSGTSLSRTVVSFDVQKPIISESNIAPQITHTKKGLSIQEMMEQATSHNLEEQQTSIQTQKNTAPSLEPQRQLAQESLASDLRENSHELQLEKNKNSFTGFVRSIDLLMQAIFWDQFDFTQKISNEAYEAKTSALEEGKTSLEATKVYQDTAAVSQKEVVDYLEKINIKHGFANATVQEQFDENGKFNRTQTEDLND